MDDFLAGVVFTGYFVAASFFLRFWTRTREHLFAIFACAFWLLVATQALVALAGVPREEQSWIYLLRLAAFVLIIVGIVAKNVRGGRS